MSTPKASRAPHVSLRNCWGARCGSGRAADTARGHTRTPDVVTIWIPRSGSRNYPRPGSPPAFGQPVRRDRNTSMNLTPVRIRPPKGRRILYIEHMQRFLMVTLAASACMTPYQRMGISGGYDE